MADDAAVPAVRASDAEREATMGRLRDAAAEGRLSFEELADRVEAAGGAATRAQLERLTSDLPAQAVVAPPAAAETASVFGDVRRSGAWVVPVNGKLWSIFGDVVLDLREARVGAAEVSLEATTVFGNVELLVPEGVEVDVRSWTVFGNVEEEAGEPAGPGAPRIVLTGGTVFGNVRARARRLRERLSGGRAY